jgi:hypothetical protein
MKPLTSQFYYVQNVNSGKCLALDSCNPNREGTLPGGNHVGNA